MQKLRSVMEKKEVTYSNDFYRSPDFLAYVQGLANSKGYDNFLKEYDISGEKKEVKINESYFIDQIYHKRENGKIKNIQTLFNGLSDVFNSVNNELLIYNEISNDAVLLEYLQSILKNYTKLGKHFPKIKELADLLDTSKVGHISSVGELASYIDNMYPRLSLFSEKKPTWYFLKNNEIFEEAKGMLFLFEHIKASITLYNYNFYELFPKLRHVLTFEELGELRNNGKEMQLLKIKEMIAEKMNTSVSLFVEQFQRFHGDLLHGYIGSDAMEKSFSDAEILEIKEICKDVDLTNLDFRVEGFFRFKDDISLLRKVVQKKIPLRDVYDGTGTLFIAEIPLLQQMISEVGENKYNASLLKKLHAVLTKEVISPKIIEYIPSIVGTDSFLEDRLKNYFLINKNVSNADYSSLQLGFGSFRLGNKLVEIPHEVIVSTGYTDHASMREKQYEETLDNHLSGMNAHQLYEYLLRYVLSTDALGYLHKSKRDNVLLTSTTLDEFKRKGTFQQQFDISHVLIRELVEMDRWTFSALINPEKIELYTKTIFGRSDFDGDTSSSEYISQLHAFAEKLTEAFAAKILHPLESELKSKDIKKHKVVLDAQQKIFDMLSS